MPTVRQRVSCWQYSHRTIASDDQRVFSGLIDDDHGRIIDTQGDLERWSMRRLLATLGALAAPLIVAVTFYAAPPWMSLAAFDPKVKRTIGDQDEVIFTVTHDGGNRDLWLRLMLPVRSEATTPTTTAALDPGEPVQAHIERMKDGRTRVDITRATATAPANANADPSATKHRIFRWESGAALVVTMRGYEILKTGDTEWFSYDAKGQDTSQKRRLRHIGQWSFGILLSLGLLGTIYVAFVPLGPRISPTIRQLVQETIDQIEQSRIRSIRGTGLSDRKFRKKVAEMQRYCHIDGCDVARAIQSAGLDPSNRHHMSMFTFGDRHFRDRIDRHRRDFRELLRRLDKLDAHA